MKKLFIILLSVVCVLANPMYVNAGHKHTDSCYSIQGAHSHTGNSTAGGGCYGTANFHVHSGDETAGGGCYGTANYHVHSGDETAGGGCYGTANYHVHSGDETAGGGCYTVQKTKTQNMTCTTTVNIIGQSSKTCSCGGTEWTNPWQVYHMNCGVGVSARGTETYCASCGYRVGQTQPFAQYTTQTHSYQGTVICYDLGCGKTEETVEYYELSCTKTAETIDGYSLSCGKTTDTVESYSLSCGQAESAGTKVLTCGKTESVDTPAPAPVVTPTPEPEVKEEKPVVKEPKEEKPVTHGEEEKAEEVSENTPAEPEETETVETIPVETVEEVVIEIDKSDFDFELEYEFNGDGLYVCVEPTNKLALAENPYSWDNKVTWNKNLECVFTQAGTYYISIKNVDGDIKTKIITVDFETETVIIEEEEVALAPSPTFNLPLKKIGIAFAITVLLGGCGAAAFFLFANNGNAVVYGIIEESRTKLGSVKIKKKGLVFETFINNKILEKQAKDIVIVPDEKVVEKYSDYSLMVKSSQRNVDTEISDEIKVNFE